MNDIEIYTKAYCPFCLRVKAYLDQHEIAYREMDIEGKPDLRAEMINRSNGGMTVPQIFIGDEHIGGSTDFFDRVRRDGDLFWLASQGAA